MLPGKKFHLLNGDFLSPSNSTENKKNRREKWAGD